eukprot:3674527-Rhodomonas_salina.2
MIDRCMHAWRWIVGWIRRTHGWQCGRWFDRRVSRLTMGAVVCAGTHASTPPSRPPWLSSSASS